MKHTAHSFRHAIQKSRLVPHTIMTDNGTEYVERDFEQICSDYQIKHNTTHPYTPEENGKIERCWETLFKANPGVQPLEFIPKVIQEYNEVWKHSSLEKNFGEKLIPLQVWNREAKWTKELYPEPTIIIEKRV
ncbi:gag-polypeptide of LTR copia-type retrotransposon (UBN2 2) family [Trichomonas vaginalis G3]|uniref:gag-polypeptide of LTR copia-type retrotransposon (UBN2 2) family n=1 Tax=Trichomonas vaginalis (strain ATCC PRA-98 / G3) TaxID=412133 RepID=UPI0021E61358|nr:gag-polypeptide of LTR copia-type retrotransposon (UBN2 2) family [Trichomonas vaginalis G3]KAI5545224.1 gag-polypeptide of LTR copia-type retrotransposon (UBN2 2) family [Trichomonas vaginalis G3]